MTTSESPLYLKTFDAGRGSLEQKIQELADREEIKELTAAYAHRLANGVSVADMFTEDGAYINHGVDGKVQEVRGLATLTSFFDTSLKATKHPPLAMIHNHQIEISGDEAIGICSNEVRAVHNGVSIIAAGWYRDSFRRVNGRWKFVDRAITMWHQNPLHDGWAKPATNP